MKNRIRVLWIMIWILAAVVLFMFFQVKNLEERHAFELQKAEEFREMQVQHWTDLYHNEHHAVTQLQAINEQLNWEIEREGK